MIELTYRPRGVCSQLIYVAIDDAGETIEDVAFYGGCAGNLLAITKLLKEASVDKTIELLEGNPCGPRPTSCTDQLTKALREAKSQVKAG